MTSKQFFEAARDGTSRLRDAARSNGMHHFERDKHVIAIHRVIDLCETVTTGTSPCGHSSAYAVKMDDKGAHITCLQCRAEAAEASPQWQPIASAPKERDTFGLSQLILLGFAPDEENYSPRTCEGYWSADYSVWVSTLDPTWIGCPQPTHWMPLPAAPKALTLQPNAGGPAPGAGSSTT